MKRNEFILPLFTVLLFAALYFIFKSVLTYIAVSAVLAILGSPLVKLYQKIKLGKAKIGKGLASFLALVSFLFILGAGMRIVLPLLAEEATVLADVDKQDVMSFAKEPIQILESLIYEYTQKSISIETYVQQKINSLLNFATFKTWLNAITSFTGGLLMAFFSISFITFFFLKDGRMFLERAKTIVPYKYRQEAHEIFPQVKRKLTRYFIGLCFEVVAVFTFLSLGLFIVDVKYFIMIALFAAIFNVIPYLGPIIGIVFGLSVIGVSYCTGTDDCLHEALPLIGKASLVFILVQLMDNILFQPFIYGKSVNAHPLEIFLVVIIFGNLGGPIAMIVAIPTWSVAKIVFQEIKKDSEFLNSVYSNKSNPEQNG